jgi:hypothetical protein
LQFVDLLDLPGVLTEVELRNLARAVKPAQDPA